MTTLTRHGLQSLLSRVGVSQEIPMIASADIEHNPLAMYAAYLASMLAELTSCDLQVAYDAVQQPSELTMGNLVVVLARLRLKDNDLEALGAALARQVASSPLFAPPVPDGVNQRMFLPGRSFAQVLLPYILDRGSQYGANCEGALATYDSGDLASPPKKEKKVIVEFSSPNLGKEFDGNHLRSTICGAFIASLHEMMGWNVRRINFLGDWGKHIGQLMLGWSLFGSETLLDLDPLRHLLSVFVQAGEVLAARQEEARPAAVESHDASPMGLDNLSAAAEKDRFFEALENGDEPSLGLWRRMREACIVQYKDQYRELGVEFDDYIGESDVDHQSVVEVETTLKEKGLYVLRDGAWIFDFKGHGFKRLGTGPGRSSNGTTSYLLRDIASAIERDRKYDFDRMIYVVSDRQDLHFQQLFKALELMDRSGLCAKLEHVSFSKVQGLRVQSDKPSLLLNDILEGWTNTIHCQMGSAGTNLDELLSGVGPGTTAKRVTAAALMVEILTAKRGSEINVGAETTHGTPGSLGLRIQEWHAKVYQRMAGIQIRAEDLDLLDNHFHLLAREECVELLGCLSQFPNILKSTMRTLESSPLVTYLGVLIDRLSDIWDMEDPTSAEASVTSSFGAALLQCVYMVLGTGLKALGIRSLKSPVECNRL